MSSKENVLWTLRQDSLAAQLKEGKRADGRKLDEVRQIHIQKEGVSENAHGIARVKLGNTDVIAGVKIDVATPYPDSPDEGAITVGVELLALASPDFEAGPPREDAIELSRVVDRGIRESKAIDFKTLPPSRGFMGSKLNKLHIAIQPTPAAHKGSLVAT